MSASHEHSYDALRDKPSPLRYLRELLAYPRVIRQHKALVWNFYRREFHGRFRGSILGTVWVLIHPIFLFATYFVVFGLLFDMRSANPAEPMHYPFYLFVGILAWTAFIETAIRSMGVVVENGNLIQKVAFPAQLLPLHLVSVNLVVYAVGVVVYLIVGLFSGWSLPGWTLLGLPAVLLVQAAFTLGLSLFLAAGYVFMRDLNQIFPIFATLWFFATPVFWTEIMLPAESRAVVDAVAPFNPMQNIIAGHRAALGVSMGTPDNPLPDHTLADVLGHAGTAAGPAVLMLIAGYVVFRSLHHRFADEV